MKQEFDSYHMLDGEKKPNGGASWGTGFSISWQRGPLSRGVGRREPNGAFVETLLDVLRDRIEFFEEAGFGCHENREALLHIRKALTALNKRTQRRADAGVEGTHEITTGDDAHAETSA